MYITSAVILQKSPSGESDLLITAFTEKYGKIRLLAQGARKEGAKLKGHLEQGTCALLGFVAGKNMYRLIEADTIETFPRIGKSFKKMKGRASIFDFTERHTMEDLRGEAGDFFSALVKFLRDLEAAGENVLFLRLLVLRAEFSLYRYLGILPDAASHLPAEVLARTGLYEGYDEGALMRAEVFSRTIAERELGVRRNIIFSH